MLNGFNPRLQATNLIQIHTYKLPSTGNKIINVILTLSNQTFHNVSNEEQIAR